MPHHPAPGVRWTAWLWVGEKVPSRGSRAQLQPKTRTEKRGVLGEKGWRLVSMKREEWRREERRPGTLGQSWVGGCSWL